MSQSRAILNLGAWRTLEGQPGGSPLRIPADHLVTHAVVVGMTGSGKSGLVMVMAEEALRARVPVLMIDVKGDLPNLLLSFADFDARHYTSWFAQQATAEEAGELASKCAAERAENFRQWNLSESDLAAFATNTQIRLITPGANSGESLHVLSSLEKRSPRWDTDPDAARSALSAAVSLVLRLLGRDPEPARSKEHVLLSVLAERRLLAGQNAELPALMQDVKSPPIAEVGALPISEFMKKSERLKLAASLNTLLASPTFASWRQGAALDVQSWLTPDATGRTPAVILSVAHLDDEERALVLGVVLEDVLSWVRSLPGSQQLKALVMFDEVYGFLPPHPANPPTKRPIVALMKQARAFGVGVVVATQNPMDLDYRALSNAGVWCIGRLQTDADRARVIDGLRGALSVEQTDAAIEEDLGRTIQRLADRWFVVKDTHAKVGPLLLQPRYAMSWLRGPMTRGELRAACEQRLAAGNRAPF
ncbi:MAG TPA: helicase HerA-like domain-containing protein [Polyangiaceae bacterium]|nr:helicase HerA-like domain-containing protein [Polyangiaceae bacterium]